MARVERSETAGRGSAVVTRGASETRSGIPRRSIAQRIAVTTAGSGRTTNGRETRHARKARRRDATNSSRVPCADGLAKQGERPHDKERAAKRPTPKAYSCTPSGSGSQRRALVEGKLAAPNRTHAGRHGTRARLTVAAPNRTHAGRHGTRARLTVAAPHRTHAGRHGTRARLTLAAPRSSLAALPPPPLEAHRELSWQAGSPQDSAH